VLLGIFYKYCFVCGSGGGRRQFSPARHARHAPTAQSQCGSTAALALVPLSHTFAAQASQATRKAGAMGVSSYSSLHHALALTLSLSVRAVHPSSQTRCSSIVPIPLLRFWVRPSICIARPCYRVAEWQRHPCNPRACGHLRHLCTVVALCPPRLPTQPAFQLALRPPHELAQSAPYCPATASVPISTPA